MTLDAMRRIPLQVEALDAWKNTVCGLDGKSIGGVLAMVPSAEADRVGLLQQWCREAGIALLGAVFPRLIDGDALVDEGAWLLALPQAPAGFLLDRIGEDIPLSAQRMAEAARTVRAQRLGLLSQGGSRLLLVFDGQSSRIGSIVDQLYLHLDGRMSLQGINAGNGQFTPAPCLFDAQRFLQGGVIGLLLPEQVRSALSLQPVAARELFTVTASQGNRVTSINGRPAFDVYSELVERDYGVRLTPGNFYEHAVHYPLAVQRADRQVLYRIPVRLHDDGAISCIGEISELSLLSVMEAPEREQMQCVSLLVRALEGQAPDGQLVLFYCAGRCHHFGDGARDEMGQLQQLLAPRSQAGALVLGEVGNINSWAYPLFYNGALLGLGWNLNP